MIIKIPIKPNQLVIVVKETIVHTSNGLINLIVTFIIIIFDQGKIRLLDIRNDLKIFG